MFRLFLKLMLLALLILPASAFAQPEVVWTRAFGEIGNSNAMDIEIVGDGIVVTGTKSMYADAPPLPGGVPAAGAAWHRKGWGSEAQRTQSPMLELLTGSVGLA